MKSWAIATVMALFNPIAAAHFARAEEFPPRWSKTGRVDDGNVLAAWRTQLSAYCR
jgi:hypothetical protein